MKTSAKLLGVVVLAAIVYPATAWYSSQHTETAVTKTFEQLERNSKGLIQVQDRRYERGLFTSEQTVTFLIPAFDNLKLAVRTHFRHGLFSGGPLGISSGTSELIVDQSSPEVAQVVRTLFKDQKPFEAKVVYMLTGGIKSTFESPAIEVEIPNQNGNARVAWGGFSGEFKGDIAAHNVRFTMPKLSVTEKNSSLEIADITGELDQKRLFEDSVLYGGTTNIAVESFTVKDNSGKKTPFDSLHIKDIRIEGEVVPQGDFLDIVNKLAIDHLEADGTDYGPVHYDFSMKHVHTRTFNTLTKQMQDLQQSLLATQGSDTNKLAMVTGMAALTQPALALLEQEPVISVDRLSFRTPEGESQVSAHITIKGFQQADLSNLPSLIGKLEAGGEATVPRALVNKLGDDSMLQPMLAQGFVTEKDGILKTKMAFNKSQLTLNDKPISVPLPGLSH